MDSKLDYYRRRKNALWTERSYFIDGYQQISKLLLPNNGRFLQSNPNQKRTLNTILDSSATDALDVLSAGLMSGMTSPARPWFRLGLADKELEEYQPVKEWLFIVTSLMREVFTRSNTYQGLHMKYQELGAFGTSAAFVRPNFERVTHMQNFTAGEYAISTNNLGIVDTLYREVPMTTEQIVAEFGIDNVSQGVKDQYQRGNYNNWTKVIHAVEPRKDSEREYKQLGPKNMAFKSCYFEEKGNGDKLLRESGFEDFPVLSPRWSVAGGDFYGYGPSHKALGDIKQLQSEQMAKGKAIDYQVDPPLQVPTTLKGKPKSLLPGGVTYVDTAGGSEAIRTAFEVNLRLDYLLADIDDVRNRIRTAYKADMFLMLANDRRSGVTATEVAERHEEKLLMLGPTLERLHDETLKPLIDITFTTMLKAQILPPPPKELEGQDLKVDFISTLAQAQKAIGLAGVDRMLMTVGSVAQSKGDPSVWDKVDTDEILDGYGDMLGIDPQYIVANDQVAMIRKERMEQAKAQQAMEQAPALAKAASDLSNTDTEGTNGLTDVMRQFSGYSSNSPA